MHRRVVYTSSSSVKAAAAFAGAAGGKMAGSNKSTDLMKNANDVTEGQCATDAPP